MRERDINRQLFHKGHYEIIAKRFREALGKYAVSEDEFETELVKLSIVTARVAIVELAVDFAKRLQADNENFEPVTFLNRCSPNEELYPLGELWTETTTT